MPWSNDSAVCGEWCYRSLFLTPDAQAYLELLGELGHLDEESLERFMESLSPSCESLRSEELVVDRAALRLRIAEFLFQNYDSLSRQHQELLGAEWPLLFG